MEMTPDQRIHIRMNDHEATTGPVTIKGCTSLVLSTYYYRSKLQPKFDHGVWVLTLGNQEVLIERWEKPAVFQENFLEPTYLGQDNKGEGVFTGKLESPLFYNEFYYHNDPWKVQRDSRWLSDLACRNPAS